MSQPLPEVALVCEANQFESIIDANVFVENAKKFGAYYGEESGPHGLCLSGGCLVGNLGEEPTA